jgi:hypothetical protein
MAAGVIVDMVFYLFKKSFRSMPFKSLPATACRTGKKQPGKLTVPAIRD